VGSTLAECQQPLSRGLAARYADSSMTEVPSFGRRAVPGSCRRPRPEVGIPRSGERPPTNHGEKCVPPKAVLTAGLLTLVQRGVSSLTVRRATMGMRATPLGLREGDRERLMSLTRSSAVRAGLAQRARIVLLAATGSVTPRSPSWPG
jgi:hypothetical protein